MAEPSLLLSLSLGQPPRRLQPTPSLAGRGGEEGRRRTPSLFTPMPRFCFLVPSHRSKRFV